MLSRNRSFTLEVCTGRAWFSPRKKRAGPGRRHNGPGRAGPGRAEPGRPDCKRAGPGLNTTGPGRAGPTIELTKTGRAGPEKMGPCRPLFHTDVDVFVLLCSG
jgi:hypothetical protein